MCNDNSVSGGMLEAVPNKLTQTGRLKVIAIKLAGKPEQILCEYQDQHAIDMTIMGAFSHSKIHDFLLGSFIIKMLTNSHKPLLLLR